jgi:hypothetical protein
MASPDDPKAIWLSKIGFTGLSSPASEATSTSQADGETAPNVGACVKEGAAFESACMAFAGVLTQAANAPIDLGVLMTALDGSGDDLAGWVSAVAGSGAALATGDVALDRMQDLIACMGQDATADPATLDRLKQRQGVLSGALAKAKASLGQSGDGETAPNIGGCVNEGAAFESASLTFAEIVSEATNTSINLAAVMAALDGSGDDLVGWVTAVSGSGAALATAYAVQDRLADLIACMSQDSAADAATLDKLKQRQSVIVDALSRAKTALGQAGDGETAPNIGGCVKEGAAFESACVTFAEVLSEATNQSINVSVVLTALLGSGDDLVGWLTAAAGSGAAIATGYATLDRVGELIACMGQDASVDGPTLDKLKQSQGVLNASLTRAKAAMSQPSAGS